MFMSISLDDIKNLETLSRLRLSDESRQSLQGEISSIIEYVGHINDLDLGFVDNSTMMHAHKNVVREDTPTILKYSKDYTDAESYQMQRNMILDNVPNRDGDFIKVKQVIKK